MKFTFFIPSAVNGDKVWDKIGDKVGDKIGDKMGTECAPKNVNDTHKGFIGDTYISNGFHAINVFQHVDVHKKLTVFLSVSCHCILKDICCIMTPHILVGPSSTIIIITAKWTVFWILQVV